MKHSTDRILTTHAGRLDGAGIVDVLRKQAEAGIDIVSDGELSKIGFGGIGYYGRRMSGLTTRKLKPDEPAFMALETGERLEFADFYKGLPFMATPSERAVCSGPIKYTGREEVGKDLEIVKAALIESGVKPEETFLCVLAPGWLEHFFLNEYYATDEEYIFALAEAVKPEYKAVVDAGFILQIDDPALPDTYDMIVPNPTIGVPQIRRGSGGGFESGAAGTSRRPRALSHLLGQLARPAHARPAASACGRSDAEDYGRRLLA